MKKENLPIWAKEDFQCLFCHRVSKASHIEVRGEDVAIEYVCANPDCRYRRYKFSEGPYVMTIVCHGFSKNYRKFLKRKKEQQSSGSFTPTVET